MGYVCSYFHTPSKAELNGPLYVTWSGYRKCLPTHCIGPRVLPYYKIVLVLRGSGFFVMDGYETLLRTGDVFFLFPHVKHHYYANRDDPWELKWAAFGGTSCAGLTQALSVTPENPILHNVMTRRLLTMLDGVIAGMEQEKTVEYGALGSLYLLFDEILRIRENEALVQNEASEDALVEKVLTFVSLNYANDLNVDVVRSHVNYSRSYFSHFFKKKTGMSLPQYINTLRVERAKELLRQTDLKVAEIANSIGYSDAFYFSRIFKQLTGQSPQQYKTDCATDDIEKER